MIAFLAILFAVLGGYAGFGPWALAISALALASIYRLEFAAFYRRGSALGSQELASSVALQSFGPTLVTFGGAYTIGLLLRVI